MHPGLRLIASAALLCVAAACAPRAQTSQPTAASAPPPAPAKPTLAPAPVTLADTESWELIAEGTGRAYPIWISLPASYADSGDRQYPVVFVTDALYSFPLCAAFAISSGRRAATSRTSSSSAFRRRRG